VSFFGTKGGQAIGFDESADAGPLNHQWAIRVYIPHTSRDLTLDTPVAYNGFGTLVGSMGRCASSTTYAGSYYQKVSGVTGAANRLAGFIAYGASRTGTFGATTGFKYDAGESAWTRKSYAFTTGATDEQIGWSFQFNANLDCAGTAFVMLPQLEQGSAATAWRNAPEDAGAPQVVALYGDAIANYTTTSTSFVAVDARSLAINFFMAYDGKLNFAANVIWNNSTSNSECRLRVTVDGVAVDTQADQAIPSGGNNLAVALVASVAVTAGKHRVQLEWDVSANTGTIINASAARRPALIITATKGK
jgi:hypothetical protein